MSYYEKNGYILVRRHWIIMFFNYLHFLFFVWLSFLLYILAIKFQENLWHDFIKYIFFPLIFIILNYAFLKLIFEIIRYFNNLIILDKENLIVIKTSIIDTDNVEIIDLEKITKIDTSIVWVFPNILAYWDLILEQNRARTRTFNHIYKPYKIATYIRDSKIKYEKQ